MSPICIFYPFLETFLITEWGKLRENYRKCLQSRKSATKSGAPGKYLETCLYFKELSFLTDVTGVRNTVSDINIPQNHLSDSSDNNKTQVLY